MHTKYLQNKQKKMQKNAPCKKQTMQKMHTEIAKITSQKMPKMI
jgi:hypothetical protein